MNRLSNWTLAAAAVASLAMAAPAAQAATTFNLIDQTVLDATGTENFGATIDELGLFTHSFTFTTTGFNDASGSVISIRSASGGKDLDFSMIDLDGVFAFTPDFGLGHEPNDSWTLTTAHISAGTHTIHVAGNVFTTGAIGTPAAASYGGTINIEPLSVPEPGTWALMIMGFGGAGALLRRRQRVAA
jgi:hypothetical protein